MRRVLLLAVAVLAAASCNIERRPTDPDTPIEQVFVLPDTITMDPSGTFWFDVFGRTKSGDTIPVDVQWTASAGLIDSDGLFTADSSEDDVTVTASLRNSPALTASAVVRKHRVVQVLITPPTASLLPGATAQFGAWGVRELGDTIGIAVIYSATGGTVGSAGLYTAGSVPGTYSVIARRRALADTAVITILTPPVASVSVSPSAANLYVGRTAQLTATLRDANGNVLTGRAINWSSSAPSVASVSASGLVSAGGVGSATITATSEGQSGSAAITVAVVPVASVVVAPASGTLRIGASAQLSATTKDSAGNTLTGRAVTWSSGNPAVATVSVNGMVNAVSTGSATITATSEGKSGTSSITVTVIPVATVTVSPASASVLVGATAQLSATTKDSAGNVLSGRVVTWSSSAAAVATVSASGLVTAVAAGSATITATSEGKLATSSITVTAVPVATVTVAPATAGLVVGGTAQLSATTKDSAGNVLSGRIVTWSSNATGVATVSASGLVTAVAAGSATITATSEGKSGTSAVTVIMVPVASVTVAPATKTLRIGTTGQLTATTKDSVGNVLNGRTVTWSSSATGVATVSAAGLVTAVAAGSATITATSEGKSGTSVITVTIVPVASVTVTPAPASVNIGSSVQLTAVTKDSAGNVLTGRAVAWSSSSLGIGTVSTNGLVSGVAVGSTTITATSEGKSGTSVVTVNDPTSIRVGKYVSPTGSSGGDGSVNRPWDINTALSGAGGRIVPGDTVWLRGGTYPGTHTSSLRGTASAPIVVRAYPGERVTLDGTSSSTITLNVDGAWTIYWGFEIMNTITTRFGSGLAARPSGVYVRNASNVKLVNLIIHDTGHGTYIEASSHSIEIYGWIVYNGGNDNSSRSDGHGIYVRNDGQTQKIIADNVIFNQFGFGIHSYAEGGDRLDLLKYEGNVLFNNGELSAFDSPNMILGGETQASQDTVRNNFFYYSPGRGGRNMRLGYTTQQNISAAFEGNYMVGGSTSAVDITLWSNLLFRNNTIVETGRVLALADVSNGTYTWSGNTHYRDPAASAWRHGTTDMTFGQWRSATNLGATDQAIAGTPSTPAIFVRPNKYERGRANVIVYNWGRQPSVSVDLSNVLTVGQRYEIRNVQDIFGTAVVSGTFGGGSVTIPMGGVAPPQPVGGSPTAPVRTGPDFDVFVVIPVP